MGNAHERKEGRYLTPVDPDYGAPYWAPDGERVAVVGGATLYIANRDGADRKQLTLARVEALVEGEGPAWSPDGQWIAFTGSRASTRCCGNEDLYVIRPDGSGLRRLTRTKASESGVAWVVPRR